MFVLKSIATGEEFAITVGEATTFGSNRDNDVRIAAPRVSSHHARLSVVGTVLRVEDLASEHGTWVNDKRVSDPATLTVGDRLKLGSQQFLCSRYDELQQTDHARGNSDGPPDQRWVLVIDKPYGDRQVVPITPGRYVLGRGHESDICIQDESVSATHASLSFDQGRWLMTDLKSTNGVMVDGVPVEYTQLLPGQFALLGDVNVGLLTGKFRVDATSARHHVIGDEFAHINSERTTADMEAL